eukprot:g21086.t1
MGWRRLPRLLTVTHCRHFAKAAKEVENLYSILGLQKGASPEQIKAAYRRLAKDESNGRGEREYHPDSLGHQDPDAAQRFQEISHAHNTLLHVGMRRMYDLQLRRKEAQETGR